MNTLSKNSRAGALNQLGDWIYRLLQPFGLSYVISYILKYPTKQNITNFSGHLIDIKNEYHNSDDEKKSELTIRFENIVDALVLENGVRKTTYSSRQNKALSSLCDKEQHHINKESIAVLDIPSSVGLSSIDMYNMLTECYNIEKYTLADQFFEVLYDKSRGCIFDDSGNLLQVKFKKQFFSIYRPHSEGNAFGLLAHILLSPTDFVAHLLKNKYKFDKNIQTTKLLLMHPEAERMVEKGLFDYRKADIFSSITGQYDLILSFNLLQKNYFSDELIKKGIDNLKEALIENGLLVMGNTESFTISRKQDGKLVTLESVGDF